MRFCRFLPFSNDNAAVIGDKACPQLLEAMIEKTKEAVAMDINLSQKGYEAVQCVVSLYHPINSNNMAARRDRLRSSAMAVSSEQSGTNAIGDSAFLGFEQHAALFEHGERTCFVFSKHVVKSRDSSVSTFVSDLGLSIARNANLVRCLRVEVDSMFKLDAHRFLEDLFSPSVEGAFTSLRSVYLVFDYLAFDYEYCDRETNWSPHIVKHLRGFATKAHCRDESCDLTVALPCLKLVASTMRHKDCGIEEVIFCSLLLNHTELLDNTLRSVRSFNADGLYGTGQVGALAGSFERTKAEGDKLARVRVLGSRHELPGMPSLIETIVSSRPKLQGFTLGWLSLSTFNVLCDVVAHSVLTTMIVGVWLHDEIDYKALAEGMGKLLQHPTIRELTIATSRDQDYDGAVLEVLDELVQSVAEGLRATHLRKFHWTIKSDIRVSSAAMTKLLEGVRENRNLMDIRLGLEGWGWLLGTSDVSPRPFRFFDFISLRNQYFSQLLMRDENTIPLGLWPLILAPVTCDASILYFLLTLKPHLVKGDVADT